MIFTVMLLSCYENTNPVIDCNIIPTPKGCNGYCEAHCTRTCKRYPHMCTQAQLQELKETGRIRDKK